MPWIFTVMSMSRCTAHNKVCCSSVYHLMHHYKSFWLFEFLCPSVDLPGDPPMLDPVDRGPEDFHPSHPPGWGTEIYVQEPPRRYVEPFWSTFSNESKKNFGCYESNRQLWGLKFFQINECSCDVEIQILLTCLFCSFFLSPAFLMQPKFFFLSHPLWKGTLFTTSSCLLLSPVETSSYRLMDYYAF